MDRRAAASREKTGTCTPIAVFAWLIVLAAAASMPTAIFISCRPG